MMCIKVCPSRGHVITVSTSLVAPSPPTYGVTHRCPAMVHLHSPFQCQARGR